MNIAICMDCGKQNKHIWEDCSGFCRDFPRLAIGLAEGGGFTIFSLDSPFLLSILLLHAIIIRLIEKFLARRDWP